MKKLLTKKELLDKLTSLRGAMPISMVTETVPKMRKTDNPFYDKVRKVAFVNCFIGAIYENSVNRQAQREGLDQAGEFEAEALRYGQHISPCIIQHKDKTYLQVKLEPTSIKQSMFVDQSGNEVAKDLLLPFLPTPSKSVKQEEFGIEKQVRFVNYSLDNIREITMQGETYQIA